MSATPLRAASEPAPITLEPLSAADRVAWDRFVENCPEASFFHRAGWAELVQEVYGHKAHYWMARSAGEIVGVLPMVHMHSWLSGNALVSVPFCVQGGIAATDDRAAALLAGMAETLGRDLGAGFVELRGSAAGQAGWIAKADRYAGFRRRISPDHEANLKAIPRKKRADVRKGIAGGLRVEITRDVAAFYRIYAESVHRLGTPVFPRRWFERLRDIFSDSVEISLVHGPNGPVAALMSFYFRDTVLPYYGGALDAARALHAYDHMYWSLMCRAAERGVRIFDFGRSKVGTGAYDYKTFWGFEPEPLRYQFRLLHRATVPDVNPLNPKYRRFVELWKRLPLPVANLIGPRLARHLG